MRSQLLQPLEIDFLVDYVNAYAAEPRIRSGDDHLPYPALATLARGAPVALGLANRIDGKRFELQLVQLANRLHGVFAKARAAPDQALASINALLQAIGATPPLAPCESHDCRLAPQGSR